MFHELIAFFRVKSLLSDESKFLSCREVLLIRSDFMQLNFVITFGK